MCGFFTKSLQGNFSEGRDKVPVQRLLRINVPLSTTSKRRIINAVLLLAVAGLAWLFYLQLQKDQAGAETLYDKSIGESVQQLTILLPGLPEIVIQAELEGSAKGWNIVRPIQAKANKQALQQLLTLLGEAILAEYPAEGKDLNDFGLAESAIRVRFNSVEYRLGKLNPVNHRRYVLLKDRILMVNEVVFELLMSGVDGFKEKS